MKFNRLIRMLFALLVIFANAGCDQVTKNIVRQEISAHDRIEVVPNYFTLMKIENTGAALSLGSNLPPLLKTIFLQLVPALILVLLFGYMMWDRRLSKTSLLAFSFIIGGGLGNIYDRVLYNSVTDFMYIKAGVFHTGVFNMADLSVTIGTAILLIHYSQKYWSDRQIASISDS